MEEPATRKLVFPSGPIDVTGSFQVESEAISNARRFLFCAIPHLEINAEHMEFDALLSYIYIYLYEEEIM